MLLRPPSSPNFNKQCFTSFLLTTSQWQSGNKIFPLPIVRHPTCPRLSPEWDEGHQINCMERYNLGPALRQLVPGKLRVVKHRTFIDD